MYDDEFIYISAKLYDSAPPDKWIANELRRDTSQLRQNDMFGVLLDTFHDRRNGYNFYTNPLGGFTDQLVTDEGNPNADWNPVWNVHAGRFDGGWTTEMAIPFKSLRYMSGTDQEWGIQMRRSIRRKNEWAHLTALPAANGGPNSVFRISQAATLVGLDLPAPGANIQAKPYRLVERQLRSPEASAGEQRPGCRVGRRSEVRHHREPHRGRHGAHRLRAGRSRRAATEPDALPIAVP